MNAIKSSNYAERAIIEETDPVNKAILEIWSTCRKQDRNKQSKTCGLAVKRLTSNGIAKELNKVGIKLSQQKVSKRLNRIIRGVKRRWVSDCVSKSEDA